MSVKQFNARYLPIDDRIMFRLNTNDQSEYIFWLTRRITHYILMSSSKFIVDEYEKNNPSMESVISEVNKSDMQAPNFTKAYEPGSQYPLGGDALLVMDAKCQIDKIEDQDIYILDLILPGGSNMNLKLPIHVMKALILLLEELNVQAKWGKPVSWLH